MTGCVLRRATALACGALCHGAFVVGVGAMAWGLWTGLDAGLGRLSGPAATAANLALLVQFPLLHSWLLTRRGRGLMAHAAPGQWGRSLAPTTFAFLAALQVGATFVLWSPSHVLLWQPTGVALGLHVAAFAAAWLFLVKALHDAGLGLQTGFIGWSALWRGRAPQYPPLPERGLFAACRQPIYLGFGLVLWTAPRWTLDHLLIALAWGAYCVVGPLLKERRFEAAYGAVFDSYRRRVPYFIPRPFR